MPFSRKYQLETERKNNVVIKNLQQQGDLPEEAPWEYISPKTGLPLLERFQCEVDGCGRLTYKYVPDKGFVLTLFIFGTNDALNRCHSCANRAGIRRW